MPGRVMDGERHLVAMRAHEDELNEGGQEGDDDEVEDRSGQGEPPQASATCHADRRGLPDGGRSREASNRAVTGEDDARAQEADARDDLRGDARRVVTGDAVDEDVGEAVLGDEHHEAGGEADDGLRSNACALASDLSLKADGRREDEGEEHPADAHQGLRHRNLLWWRGWV